MPTVGQLVIDPSFIGGIAMSDNDGWLRQKIWDTLTDPTTDRLQIIVGRLSRYDILRLGHIIKIRISLVSIYDLCVDCTKM